VREYERSDFVPEAGAGGLDHANLVLAQDHALADVRGNHFAAVDQVPLKDAVADFGTFGVGHLLAELGLDNRRVDRRGAKRENRAAPRATQMARREFTGLLLERRLAALAGNAVGVCHPLADGIDLETVGLVAAISLDDWAALRDVGEHRPRRHAEELGDLDCRVRSL